MYFKRQKIESEVEAEDIMKTLSDIDSRLKYVLTQMKVPHEKGLQLSEERLKKYSVQEYVKTAIILLERRIPKDLREYKGDLKVPGIVVVNEDDFKVFEKNAILARDYMQEVLDDLKINDEVSDFILDLVDNEDIPEGIRNKAGELWKKI